MKTIREKKLKKIYEVAKMHGSIIDEPFPKDLVGMSLILPNGECLIFVGDEIEEPYTVLEVLAHELGHYMTNGFYDIYTPYYGRKNVERLADLWAYYFVMNPFEVEKAYKEGIKDIDDLAYYFGVSQEFVEEALEAYDTSEGADFLESYCEFRFGNKENE